MPPPVRVRQHRRPTSARRGGHPKSLTRPNVQGTHGRTSSAASKRLFGGAYVALAAFLLKQRRLRKLSPATVRKRTSIHPSRLRRIESGKVRIAVWEMEALAVAYAVDAILLYRVFARKLRNFRLSDLKR
jgi:hypothetical protein